MGGIPEKVRSEHISELVKNIKHSLVPQFERFFLFDFEIMLRHVEIISEQIRIQRHEYDSAFAEQIKDMDSEEQALYADYMLDETAFIDALPRMQWRSQFLLAYSTFEHHLNLICKIAQKQCCIKSGFMETSGLGVERAAKYLRKEIGVVTPFKTEDWQNICLLGRLRNKIAHANGVFDEGNSDLVILKSMPGFKNVRAEGLGVEVDISADFVSYSLSLMYGFLNVISTYKICNLARP